MTPTHDDEKLGSVAQRKAQQHSEERLWQMIHSDNRVLDASFASVPNPRHNRFSAAESDDETASLLEISHVVRATFQEMDEQPQIAESVRDSFAPIHTQLMNTIERDVQVKKSEAKRARFSWPRSFRVLDAPVLRQWATTVAIVALTAIGSHSLGFYRATQNAWLQNADAAEETSFVSPKRGAARVLPVQSLVDEFDASLRHDAPLEFVADDKESSQNAARRLKTQLGVAARLPFQPISGFKLLGARRQGGSKRLGMQAHYVKNGVRVAVYQLREPSYGMGNLREIEWNGQLFLTGDRGAYRVVAWRSGDDVMTLVSPLAMQTQDSLSLAEQMRHAGSLM